MKTILTQAEANELVKRSVVVLVNGVPFVNGAPVRGRIVAGRVRRAYELRAGVA